MIATQDGEEYSFYEVCIGDTIGSEAAEVVERGFGLNLRLLCRMLGDIVCRWRYDVVFSNYAPPIRGVRADVIWKG